jgi:hypothetical protein
MLEEERGRSLALTVTEGYSQYVITTKYPTQQFTVHLPSTSVTYIKKNPFRESKVGYDTDIPSVGIQTRVHCTGTFCIYLHAHMVPYSTVYV